jgi:hypothetical protein
MYNTPEQWWQCSYTDTLDVPQLVPDKYRLFVYARDGEHGSQIVSTNGGTGDLDRAKVFDAAPGQTVAVKVLLDKAGSITGVVRDKATGKPTYACASVLPAPTQHANSPTDGGVGCTDDTGRYTISGLGPYTWKVEFPAYDDAHAWQWSGGSVNRTHAAGVKVTVGGTATANADLLPTAVIKGNAVSAGREPVDTEVVAVDAESGDYAGFHGWPEFGTGAYTLTGLGNQRVWVVYRAQSWAPPFTVRYKDRLTTRTAKTIDNIDFSLH